MFREKIKSNISQDPNPLTELQSDAVVAKQEKISPAIENNIEIKQSNEIDRHAILKSLEQKLREAEEKVLYFMKKDKEYARDNRKLDADLPNSDALREYFMEHLRATNRLEELEKEIERFHTRPIVDFLKDNELDSEVESVKINEILKKTNDTRDGKGLLLHCSNAETETLRGILTQGILSHKFAKRIGMREKREEGRYGEYLRRGYAPEIQRAVGMEKISFFDGDLYTENLKERLGNLEKFFEDFIAKKIVEFLKLDAGVHQEIVFALENAKNLGELEKDYPELRSYIQPFLPGLSSLDFLVPWTKIIEKNLSRSKGQYIARIKDSDLIEIINKTKYWALQERKRMVSRKYGFNSYLKEHQFGIIIQKSDLSEWHKAKIIKAGWPTEVLLKVRIAPCFFGGLIFHSKNKFDDGKGSFLINFLKKYKIPVYNEEGNVVWPVQMAIKEALGKRKSLEKKGI